MGARIAGDGTANFVSFGEGVGKAKNGRGGEGEATQYSTGATEFFHQFPSRKQDAEMERGTQPSRDG